MKRALAQASIDVNGRPIAYRLRAERHLVACCDAIETASRGACRVHSWSAVVLLGLVAAAGCSQRESSKQQTSPAPGKVSKAAQPERPTAPPRAPFSTTIDLPQPAQRLGTAVVVLIDTSGSMLQTVSDRGGKPSPKNQIAGESLARIVRVTEDWHKQHPESPLFLGIESFSSRCDTVLPVASFDATAAQAAIKRIPPPGGGTAIGLAIEKGFKRLYETGCVRKHLVCITDGQNTVATPPELMARQLHSQTKGDVEIHFVAFDTAARHFAFLQDVNGSVVEAADGAQLQERLVELYEKRILAEAMPAEKE